SLVPPGEEWPLHAGDLITLGPLEFMVQFHEQALARRDLEEWALGCLDQTLVREFDDPDEAIKTMRQAGTGTPARAAAALLDRLQARRGVVMGRLRVGKENDITIVRFNDPILVEEAEIALIKKELHDHLNKSNMRVLIDCKNIRRMSTSAVRMIDELSSWL